MVLHPRTSAHLDQLRPLSELRPLQVELANGFPVALIANRQRHRITSIQDTWIIEDEWWRQPISRQYFAVRLGNGQARTIYHDRLNNHWFTQAD